MMVANDISNDSRVLKEAAALAEAGLRVTLLGVSRDGRLSMDSLDGRAVMARLPGIFTLRDGRTSRRARRRSRRLLGAHLPEDQTARRAAIAVRRAELRLRIRRQWARRLRGHFLWIAFLGMRARHALTGLENRAFKTGWRCWDGLVARIPWRASWPSVVPEAFDYELIFQAVIDELAPDVVHAHDMHVIGVAVRAAARAELAGRTMKVVYDAHEYVPGIARYGGRTPRFIAAWANHERDYIRAVDRVVTVSPAIAERLQLEHKLPDRPEVVLNTPDLPEVITVEDDIRSRIGLPADIPLLVYSGGITIVRGIDTAIRALPSLPGVHLAIVAVPTPDQPAVDVLRKLAAEVGVADRVHYLHPVGPREVTGFLATADAGIIPMLRAPNHEMAMPNKLFEYSLGGLPLLVSDMASLKEFVGRHGIGEAFEAGNSTDFAAKAKLLLSRTETYCERLADPAYRREAAWSGQAGKLRRLYGELLGRDVDVAEKPWRRQLLIGPVNAAGQAWQLARALERHDPSIAARSLQVDADDHDRPADITVLRSEHRPRTAWQIGLADQLQREVTHVLLEAGRSLLGEGPGLDVPLLDRAGIKHALLLPGPDGRPAPEELRAILAGYDGPRFVSDPGLLAQIDDIEWLPLVVDLVDPASVQPVMQRPVPVVATTRSGDEPVPAVVDAALTGLAARGVIEYRQVQVSPRDDSVAWMREVDIVVADLFLGSYGMLACQAMAAGRVTVGQVPKEVRERLPAELPIVQASPDDLAAIIEQLAGDRTLARLTAAEGPRYAREVHDGRRSVEVLLPFLA
jgi:glycosyltransferase involved in cell wall biosynthesis